MNSLDRFSQSIAEDAQRSAILTYSDARVLNHIDVAIAALNEALKDTTAIGDDAAIQDFIYQLETFKADKEEA
jgi:hypothetical protein